jgi:hypothetical protein
MLKKGLTLTLVCALLVFFAGQAQSAFPPRGDDTTESLGSFRILVNPVFQNLMNGYPGYDPATARLESPILYDPVTVIGRSDAHVDGDATDEIDGAEVGTAGTIISDGDFSMVPPGFEGPAGTREVHTEVRTLNMTHASGAAVRAGTTAPDQPISPGEVESKSDDSGDPNQDFPAESFFDIFVEVDLPQAASFPGGTLYNPNPLLIFNDNLDRFPPKVVYIHGKSSWVWVLFKKDDPGGAWSANDVFGVLVLAGHGIGYGQRDIEEFDAFMRDQEEMAPPDICVGFDLFRTKVPGAYVDIPGIGRVDLEGNPGLIDGLGDTDTIVERLEPLCLPEGETGEIKTELVVLSLSSTGPIQDLGPLDPILAGVPADLYVTVDKEDQFPRLPQPDPLEESPGKVTVTGYDGMGGGTFDSELKVIADLIFTEVGGDPNNDDDVLLSMPDPVGVELTSAESIWSYMPPLRDQHNEDYPAGNFYVIEIEHVGPHPVEPSEPVELSLFTATTTTDDVTLRWRTESETNNLGFSIYRSDAKDGKYTKVNARLIQGAGTDAAPHDYSFTDEDVVFGFTYYYYIEDIDFSGKTNKSHIIEVTVGKRGIKTHLIPLTFALLQNYPNPFNPDTWIPYDLAGDANVRITIYNSKGVLIRTLSFGVQPAGSYLTKDKAAYWNGRNYTGEPVSSGVYFYHLQAGDYHATKRMIILK